MATEQNPQSQALAALLNLADEIVEDYYDYIGNGGLRARELIREYRRLRYGVGVSARAGEVCENHPSRPVAAPSRVLCAECLQIAYAEARESAGEASEAAIDVPPTMASGADALRALKEIAASNIGIPDGEGWETYAKRLLAIARAPLWERAVSAEQIVAIRRALADYMQSEGCGCCGSRDEHEVVKAQLAKLLRVPMYADKSGYNFARYITRRGFRPSGGGLRQ